MSPEQIGSESADVDTRSDVYSLGVVLYQLLAGKLPYDMANRSLPEAVRMIKDEAPARLSAVTKTFRGDLETIVSKALEKDKNRRYQSAAELGGDLQRFLLGEPISAKRDSSLYILRKHVVRYKGIVAAASIAVLALAAYGFNAVRSVDEYKRLVQAEREALTAEQNAREIAQGLSRRLGQELAASNIERGKLESAKGNVILAEEFLWREYLQHPESRHAYWALWDMYVRNPCRRTTECESPVLCAALSPDRALLAAACTDRVIRIFRTADGELDRQTAPLSVPANAVAFSPAGDRLVVALDRGEAAVVPLSGEMTPVMLGAGETGPAHPGGATAAAWSPNGKIIATGGSDRSIRTWSAATLAPLAAWEAHTTGVSCLAFSPDSGEIASGATEPNATDGVRFWSPRDGSLTNQFPTDGAWVSCIGYSPDDSTLAVGLGFRALAVFDLETGRKTPAGVEFTSTIAAFDFAKDNRRLLALGGAAPKAIVLPNPAVAVTLAEHRGPVVGGGWIAGSQAITISTDGAIKLWDVRRTIGMRGHGGFESWCFGTDYSGDGSKLAVGAGDGTVAVIESATKQRLATVTLAGTTRTRAVRFQKEGDVLLTGSSDGVLRVCDAATGEVRAEMSDSKAEIYAIAIQPGTNGAVVAAACGDKKVRIWNVGTREKIGEIGGFQLRVEGVAFSPDGSLLAASGFKNGVSIFRSSDWTPAAKLEGSGEAWTVAFSPDGQTLAAGTWNDRVDLWNVQSRKFIGAMAGHRGLLSTIAFSPDGRYLASGGDDATVRLWDVKSLRPLLTFQTSHGEATGISFDPTGQYITTGCQNHMVLTWDLAAGDNHILGNTAYNKKRFGADGPDADRRRPDVGAVMPRVIDGPTAARTSAAPGSAVGSKAGKDR